MTVNVRIAIASHLSDAQEYLELGFRKNASSEINLAKAILFKYVSTDLEVEVRELNELAHEVLNRQRQTSTWDTQDYWNRTRGTGIFRWTRIASLVAITAMSITVLSSGAERRLPATGMSLSLLTKYKGNGQSNQLPTNLLAMEEKTDPKKEQIRRLMDKARKDGKTIDWAKVVLC